MLDKNDLKWLKDNLATKGDIKNLNKKFTQLFNFLDKEVSNTKKRIKTIEESLGITPDLAN